MTIALDPTTRRVAQAVLRQGPVSRAELGRMLGLSSPSLTRLTKPLLASGLLVEGEPVAPQATGRPAVPLDVVATRHTFVGAKFVTGGLHAVLTDLKGSVLKVAEVRGDLRDPQAAVSALAEVVERWSTGRRPVGIGIGLGASVDDQGVVSQAGFMGWPQLALADVLERRCGLACVVENDVTALALAEHWFGFGRGTRDFAVVTLGMGVGSGLVCGDELVRGHLGRAGMVGALRLSDGRRVDDVVQFDSLLPRLSQAVGRDLEPDPATLAALAPEASAAPVLDDVAMAMGELVGQLLLVSAPERVLVSGEGAGLLVGHEPALHQGLSRYSSLAPECLSIEVLGFDEWARGAATVAIRQWLA